MLEWNVLVYSISNTHTFANLGKDFNLDEISLSLNLHKYFNKTTL